MRTIFLFIFLFLFSFSTCLAQSVSRQVIGSAGGDANIADTSVSWTIGEPVVETFSSGDYMLLQGFHVGAVVTSEYTISLSANPSEGGTVSGGGTYEENTEITISASSNEGYVFDSWTESGAVISTDSNYTFEVTEDINLTANFTDGEVTPKYTISLSSDPSEGGTVSGGGTYLDSTEVTISATPDEGYVFDGWISNGDTISHDSIYTFIIIRDISITAHFSSESVGLRDAWRNLSVEIYPNPAEDRLIIDFEEPKKESYTLRLISTHGKQIINKELPSHTKRETIDLSRVESGLYVVEIYNSTKKQTFTLIKK